MEYKNTGLIPVLTAVLALAWHAAPAAADTASGRMLKIAVLQAGENHYQNGNPGFERNFAVFDSLARAASASKPDLIVFPEYALSGWPYPDEERMNSLAESVPGNGIWYRAYVRLARDIRTPLLGWMLDREENRLYNTAFLLDENGGFAGKYRKVHANLGEQTWWGWSQGNSLAPVPFRGVRYGVSICADMWFPETVRAEALLGADVIVHQSISDDMEHVVPVRAADSGVPIVMSIFRGGSYAVDDEGKLLGKCSARNPEWRTFELAPFRVRTEEKYGGRWIPKEGQKNLRSVEAYGALVDPSTRPAWTDVFLDSEGLPQSRDDLLKRFNGRYDRSDPSLFHEPMAAFDSVWTSPYRVDPAFPHHFVNREGRHLFVLNKTAWAYFGCKRPEEFLRKAQRQGVTVIRVALEGTPYWKELGIELWPWGGTRRNPDWTTFNAAYWDEAGRRIRLAGEHGIGIDLVLYFTLHPDSTQIEIHRPYWEQALRAFGKYANVFTWEIANEYTANETFQDAAAAHFKKRDPYGRPVCTSDGTSDDAVWPGKPWMDIAVVHTCTGSTPAHDLRTWYQAVARNVRSHGKPAYNNESGREIRHRNDDPVHRRKQGWTWTCSGGYWTWHSWEGCEGIDDVQYLGPGTGFLKPMSDFFRSIPFWRLDPNHTTIEIEEKDVVLSVLAEPDRSLALAYACTPQSGQRTAPLEARIRLPKGKYAMTTIHPVDWRVEKQETIESRGLNLPLPVVLPGFRDDLLVKIERLDAR